MDATTIYKELLELTTQYKAALTTIPAAEFMLNPTENSWSYSEVYHHVFDLGVLSLKAVANIIAGKGREGQPTLVAKDILLSGMFPQGMRMRVPEQLEGRVKKVSKAEAEAFILLFEKELEKIYPTVTTADVTATIPHPRLGDLNAIQWLRFTEIHLRHHLKQIDRIRTGTTFN